MGPPSKNLIFLLRILMKPFLKMDKRLNCIIILLGNGRKPPVIVRFGFLKTALLNRIGLPNPISIYMRYMILPVLMNRNQSLMTKVVPAPVPAPDRNQHRMMKTVRVPVPAQVLPPGRNLNRKTEAAPNLETDLTRKNLHILTPVKAPILPDSPF